LGLRGGQFRKRRRGEIFEKKFGNFLLAEFIAEKIKKKRLIINKDYTIIAVNDLRKKNERLLS